MRAPGARGCDSGSADGGHASGTCEEGYAAARGRDGAAARARARCRSSCCCEQRTYRVTQGDVTVEGGVPPSLAPPAD